MRIKKFLSVMLAVALLFSVIPITVTASAETTSGTTGDCTWTLDGTHLTISGNGDMNNYAWGDYAPWGEDVTSVTIEQGVTSIGNYAFSGCTSLTSITIPDSVTNIGSSAFSGCTGLTSITIPDSVTSIGRNAFEGCKSLTSVTIPDSVTSIGNSAFYGCTGLTSITIGNGVISMDYGTFFGCINLKDVYYTGDLSGWCKIIFDGELSSNPMCYATRLYINGKLLENEITIPNDVTSISWNAFYGCADLTSITIPDSVTSIGDYAFEDCTSLTSITIPDSVTNIGGWAFYNTAYYNDDKNWTGGVLYIGNHLIKAKNNIVNGDYTIRQGTKCIAGWAFSNCTGLTSVTIPDSVTRIVDSAFYGCTRLTNTTIPDSVTSIGETAFIGCTGLTSITIPGSVTSIGYRAFEGCTGLTSITLPDSVTSIGDYAFEGCDNLVIITTENSTAHKYAAEHNIKFELIVKPVTVEGEDKTITILTDSSVIPSEGVSLSTEKVENIGEKYETQLKNLGAEKFAAYNIDLMKGEEKVQPNGKVTVSIAVPDGMDGAKCKVYRAESDGTLTDMKASLNDGKLTFTTDHFSLYIITQSAVKLGDVDGDGGVTIKDAIAILRHNAEVELLTGSQIIAGDLNGDGAVNTKDAILLLQYNAQIIDKFPIE